jgi:integrase
MARIFERNGWKYADYFDANGVRQKPSLKTKNQRLALMKLSQLVGDAHAGRVPDPARHKLWRLCVDRYLEWVRREQDPKTYRADALAFKRYEEMYHPQTMFEVTPESVSEFKWQMEKDQVGVYARERAIRALKASLPRLEEAEGLPVQNWHRVKNVKLPNKGRVIFFTHEEMQEILKACRKPHWKTIVLLGARAGLRAGEIYNLLWENVLWDFGDFGAVDICHKADWSPKCGKARIVPITSELRDHLLQEHKRARSRWVVAEGEWRPSGIDSLGHVFHKILRAIGLKGMMHKLRHTYGSDLARLGKSEKQIMELMGHSTSRAVQIYMHLQPKDVVSVVNDLKPYS